MGSYGENPITAAEWSTFRRLEIDADAPSGTRNLVRGSKRALGIREVPAGSRDVLDAYVNVKSKAAVRTLFARSARNARNKNKKLTMTSEDQALVRRLQQVIPAEVLRWQRSGRRSMGDVRRENLAEIDARRQEALEQLELEVEHELRHRKHAELTARARQQGNDNAEQHVYNVAPSRAEVKRALQERLAALLPSASVASSDSKRRRLNEQANAKGNGKGKESRRLSHAHTLGNENSLPLSPPLCPGQAHAYDYGERQIEGEDGDGNAVSATVYDLANTTYQYGYVSGGGCAVSAIASPSCVGYTLDESAFSSGDSGVYLRNGAAASQPVDETTASLGHASGQAYRFGHPRHASGSASTLDPIAPTAAWCNAIDTNQYWFTDGTHAPRVHIEQMSAAQCGNTMSAWDASTNTYIAPTTGNGYRVGRRAANYNVQAHYQPNENARILLQGPATIKFIYLDVENGQQISLSGSGQGTADQNRNCNNDHLRFRRVATGTDRQADLGRGSQAHNADANNAIPDLYDPDGFRVCGRYSRAAGSCPGTSGSELGSFPDTFEIPCGLTEVLWVRIQCSK